MALVWKETPITDPLVTARYYEVDYKVIWVFAEAIKTALTFGIKEAAKAQGSFKIQSVKYDTLYNKLGKTDGSLVRITFQVIDAEQIQQAGLDLRGILLIFSAAIFGVLAINGSLYKFFSAIDTTAETAKEIFNPATLILLIIGALIFIPMFRKGIA